MKETRLHGRCKMKGKKLNIKLGIAVLFSVLVVGMSPNPVFADSTEGRMAADYAVKYYECGMSLDEIRTLLLEEFGKEEIVNEAFLLAAEYTGNEAFLKQSSGGKKTGSNSKKTIKTVQITSVKYDKAKNSYQIKWSPSKQTITGYRIYYSTKVNGKYTLLKEVKKGKKSLKVGSLKKGKNYYFKMTAYLKKSGKTYESQMSKMVYDPSATSDLPVVVDLEGNSSVPTISFSGVDKVGKKAFLTWKTPTDKKVTGIQILRKDSNVDYCVVVADIKDVSRNLFIDTKANSKTVTYYIRCVAGNKVGNTRNWAYGNDSGSIRWYKGDGAYYRVDLSDKEYYGVPSFKQYNAKTLDLIWNCDWAGGEYNQIAELDSYSNKYQYVLEPAGGFYENPVTAYLNVTDKSFEYMWHETVYDSEKTTETGFVKKGSRI